MKLLYENKYIPVVWEWRKDLKECLPAKIIDARKVSSRRAEKDLIRRWVMINGRIARALGTCINSISEL